jgi:porin
VGGWLYTRSRAGWIEDDQRDQGLYATVESRLYSEEADAAQGLAGFVRLGLANGKINRFSGYTGAGLVYTGLFNKRSEDQAGMAVAVPWSSPDYQAVVETPNLSPADYEMNVEVTYRFVFSSNIQFQLDAQYVINPNTLLNNDNAFLAGTRLLLSF